MTIENNEGPGVVITIGSGGHPVDSDTTAVNFANQIAYETGTTIIVTELPHGEDVDGHPIQVNPSPAPSAN